MFWYLHNIPVCGKTNVFTDLHFKVKSGEHVKSCAEVLKDDILKEIKQASAFSELPDETADIGGEEQPSFAV